MRNILFPTTRLSVISTSLLYGLMFYFLNSAVAFAQTVSEQAYGFSLRDKGRFNNYLSPAGSSPIVVGQFNGHGIIAQLKPNGEPMIWQAYDTLLRGTSSNFTSAVMNTFNGGAMTVAGLCTDCMPNRRGQAVVVFRIGADLKPLAVNGKLFHFLAPSVDSFQARTTVAIMVNAYDLFVAYEGDSGFGSDIYLSKWDDRNFTSLWQKQYNTSFFELPVLLANDSVNTLGLGLHGWGKTRLLKINTLDGSIRRQFAFADYPGRFVYQGSQRYFLAYSVGDRIRVSMVNGNGVETDSTYIPQNYPFNQLPAMSLFSDTKLGIAANYLEANDLPYYHFKTRMYLLNTTNLTTGRTSLDLPNNGAYNRQINQIISHSSSGELFSLLGERPSDATPRPFFLQRHASSILPTMPPTWYNAAVCADPQLIQTTTSKTYPHTLPYVYNNVVYATKPNFKGVSEPLWLDIYRPYDHYAKNSSDKRPALVFFNGGGYIGMNEDAAEFALQAAQRGMIGISVKYRVGVHPHFTGRLDSLIHYLPFYQKTIYRAVQDARDAVRFVFNNAATYNIDPNRIFVGGHSAGGSLILNYAYVGQNDFPANMATELGSLAAKTPIAGLIPYAAPFNTTSFTSPVDPLSYIQGNENEPIFMIHGTCDSAAYFNRGNPFDPSSLYNVGAYGLACKKQELNQPYHLLAIKGGDHTFSTEQAMVYESLFKWIKQKSICGTPDRACETVTVVNNQPCALVSLCPTCRPNRVVDNPEVQIQVYPNPTVDYLTIQVSMNRKTMDVPKVLIYNAFGQLLETGVLTKNTEGVYFRQFSTAQLSSGIYWLRFYADGQVWMEKMFVKL